VKIHWVKQAMLHFFENGNIFELRMITENHSV
jgi:hypothetical protein